MKKQLNIILGAVVIGLSCIASVQADEQSDAINAAQLQAAIEAFGVPTEQAEKAAARSVTIIDQEKKASDKNAQDMLIVSDDFFTLESF